MSKDNAVLEDFLPAGHQLIKDTFKIYKVTLDADGKESKSELVDSSEYTLADKTIDGSHGFTVKFNKEISSAYKIEYSTNPIEPIFNSGNAENKVKSVETEKTATRYVQQVVLIKNSQNPNYKEKTVDWKIELNGNSFKMEDLVLTDSFVNGGLELVEDSFKITKANQEVLTKNTDYELVLQEKGFTVKFLNPVEEKLIITYTTKFNNDWKEDDSKPNFTNNAEIHWIEEGAPKEKTTTAEFKPDEYTTNNGYKNGSYNPITKEITWEIGINYNLKSISKAIIEDYILQGQKLVDGSIEVFHAEPLGGKNEFSKGAKLSEDQFTVDTIENGETLGFKLAFNQSINSGYIITYKTTLDNQLIVEKYDNTATLYDDTQKLTDLNAGVAVKHGGEYVNKDGLQDGKVIDWTVYINRGQSTIADATISDTPSENLILVEDSFVVYKTEVNQDGTISKGDVLDSNAYTLEFTENDEGKPTFKLSFNNTIETAYMLEYQTYINAQHGATVSNKVKLNGAGLTTEVTETSKSIVVRLSGGGGSGSGETGQLVVTKVDADNTEKLLPGAKFTLYDSEGKIPIKTVTTDEKGQAIFDGLLYDDYILKETAAPEGYFIEIQGEEKVTIDEPQVSVTVTNKKLHQAVELTKLDADDESITLADATFKLLRYNGTEYVDIGLTDLKTDANGRLAIPNLQPGEYQLIETVAPLGYELDATPIPFTITEIQTEIVKVSHVNKKHIDAVELTKVKKGDHSVTLAGAVFDLLDEYGNVISKDLTTNNEGKIIIPALQPGNYQFIETKSPSGYRLSKDPLNFIIENDQKETVKVTFENEVIRSGGGGGGNSGGGNGGNNGGNNPGDSDGNNGGGNNPGDSDGDNNGGNNPGDTDGNNNGGSNPGGSDGNNNNGNNPEKPNGNNGGGSSGDTNGNNGGKNPGKPNGNINGNNNSGNSNGEVAAGNSNNSNSDTNYELPKTATNMYSLLVIGLLLLLSAFSIMFVTKLRNS
ncbi:collagen binding domain-containing protein [Lysinibacillus telephonicus]|uniref:collagen binding domain-containing protein n=1 Tax=Lysinibacillus telephonicus TaxID=1714840 RepID=UPI001FEB4370|nr:collagen binding domain-containing protein [Lysinibacillus telephonicus]